MNGIILPFIKNRREYRITYALDIYDVLGTRLLTQRITRTYPEGIPIKLISPEEFSLPVGLPSFDKWKLNGAPVDYVVLSGDITLTGEVHMLLDYSNMVAIEVEAVAGEEILLPFTHMEGSRPDWTPPVNHYIDWGDNVISEFVTVPPTTSGATAVTIASHNYAKHTYSESGTYTICWVIPEGDVGRNYISGNNQNYLRNNAIFTPFRQRVRNCTQLIDNCDVMFLDWTGLKRVDAVLKPNTGITYMQCFEATPNLEYVNPLFLRESISKSTIALDNMFNGSGIILLDDDFFVGYNSVQRIRSMFAGATRFQPTSKTFQYFTEVTNASGLFNASGITHVPDNMLKASTKLSNVANMFRAARSLRTVGHTIFNNIDSPLFSTTDAINMFDACTRLAELQSDSLIGLVHVVSFNYGFRDCQSLKEIPKGLFDTFTDAYSFIECFLGCIALTSVPTELFKFCNPQPPSTLTYGPYQKLFYDCTSLSTIPEDIFWYYSGNRLIQVFENSGLTIIPDRIFEKFYGGTATRVFYNTRVTQIPEGLFSSFNTRATLSLMFAYTRVESVSANLLNKYCRGLTGLFQYCTRLRGVDNTFFDVLAEGEQDVIIAQIFDHCSLFNLNEPVGGKHILTEVGPYLSSSGSYGPLYDVFGSCGLITSIPIGFFDTIPAETTVLNGTFAGCTIHNLQNDMFTNCPAKDSITTIYSLWGGTFTEVPENLFSPLSALESITFTLIRLSTIPSNLFRNNPNLKELAGTFSEGTFTEIPSTLFSNNPNLYNINHCFAGCRNLTSVDGSLFANNSKLYDLSFCFQSTAITSLPNNLFANQVNLELIEDIFATCTKLTTVPNTIFDNCLSLKSVWGAFNDCSIANIQDLFSKNKNINNFNSCFRTSAGDGGKVTSLSPTTPEGYRLWERAGKPGYPTTVQGVDCFRGLTNMADYNDPTMPEYWK